MQYKAKFAKFTVPQATGGAGNLAAIPADIGPGALFYRKDLLDKAGVTEAQLTQSWDSYIAAGKKLKTATAPICSPTRSTLKDIYIRSGLKDGEGIYFDKQHPRARRLASLRQGLRAREGGPHGRHRRENQRLDQRMVGGA